MPSLAEALGAELSEAPRLVRRQIELTQPLLESNDCIIAVGSGDSFSAAVALEADDARVIAQDPLDALRGGRLRWGLSRGCVLLALSVGGRTRNVVEAAKWYRSHGGYVAAVTASLSSPLARVADIVVEMVYGGLAGGIGAVRHLVMLAAASRLLGREAWIPRGAPPGECFWLRSEMHAGCLSGYSAALFSALKLYEVYGSSVRYERLEQLVHAPVYSTGSVTLYGSSGGPCSRETRKVYDVLRGVGLRAELVEAGNEGVAGAMEHAYRILWCLYDFVTRDGVAEPAYRRHRGLAALTELIYG